MMHSPDGNIGVKKWKVRGERDSLEAEPKDEASDEWIELVRRPLQNCLARLDLR
jgi:hypothetical protein